MEGAFSKYFSKDRPNRPLPLAAAWITSDLRTSAFVGYGVDSERKKLRSGKIGECHFNDAIKRDFYNHISQAWWYMPLIPALGKLTHED
jgi:hypothetical protein